MKELQKEQAKKVKKIPLPSQEVWMKIKLEIQIQRLLINYMY